MKVSVEDTRKYLATLSPKDHAATCNQSTGCLIAETIRWKFKPVSIMVSQDDAGMRMEPMGRWQIVEVEPELLQIAERFDKMGAFMHPGERENLPGILHMQYPQRRFNREQVEQAFPELVKGESNDTAV
jgi:hypothetical protein